MIFVRQFEVSPENSGLQDYTGFYVFIPQGRWSDADIRVVTQQY